MFFFIFSYCFLQLIVILSTQDPESKKKFLEGIKNMANHGVPNGIFDIMVSASAQNLQNIKTIETLTQVHFLSFFFLKNSFFLIC